MNVYLVSLIMYLFVMYCCIVYGFVGGSCIAIAILQISPDFPVHQKKSGWLYIRVVVVVVVVCTRRLGTRTNMSATEVE